MWRIYVNLDKREANGLRLLAERDFRPPRHELRWILRKEIQRRWPSLIPQDTAIERALEALDVPGAEYPAPVAEAIRVLREAIDQYPPG